MSPLHFLDLISYQERRIQPYGRIMALVTPLLTLTFVIGLVSFQLLHFTFVEARIQRDLVRVPGTLTPRIAQSHLLKAAASTQHLELAVGLRPRNPVGIEQALQRLFLSKTNGTLQPMTAEQYSQQFGPTEQTYTQVQRFLEHGGLRITRTYNHRLLVDATGTVAQIEQLLHVTINIYTDRDGHTYYANSNEPVLPSTLAGQVLSINGLNNASSWSHETYHIATTEAQTSAQGSLCPSPEQGRLTPDGFARAYAVDDLYRTGNRGEGQNVALFELSTGSLSDLSAYTACFGHSHTVIQIIKTSSKSPDSNGEGVTDAELILGAVPLLNTLRIYEAANDDSSYLSQWAQIVQDAPAVVASNWSQCELDITPQVVQQEYIFFQLAALQRQTILTATGAPGSSPCPGDSNHTPISTGVVDPAAQPLVTAVGGTALTLRQRNYGYETTWNVNTAGGGLSRYWTLPAWQHVVGVPDPVYSASSPCASFTGNTGKYCREIPDVSLNADLAHGYWTYCSVGNDCNRNKPWMITGGTAAATSLWAAFTVLTNELYAREGGTNIGFLDPLLYQIADDPVKYAHNFQHVMIEPDEIGQHSQGRYPATVGYNMATGLGSYNALSLATNLVELVQTRVVRDKQPVGVDTISLQPRH